MRLEYISHSCFVIETCGTRIAFDPWITGSAYADQWHLFPKPVNTFSVTNADIILISHGHEDHLHEESLQLINKSAEIFFPFQWREGIVEYLNSLSFNRITEALSFKTYRRGNINITYLGYSLESVIVVECEGLVIVNINDSLNSNHETAVNFLLKKIKSRWNKIDFLLSGWSGAGYFPNKVHYNNKDDKEIALIREQYFADNFCRFTEYLQPEISIPFSPGFVLLANGNRWINSIKFPREEVIQYYKNNFNAENKVLFPITYPGDYFINKEFFKTSVYHQNNGDKDLYKELDLIFKKEIAEINRSTYTSEEDLNILLTELIYWLNRNKSLYHKDVLEDVHFSIRLSDVSNMQFLNVQLKNGDFIVQRCEEAYQDDQLIITAKASLISKNLARLWGGDLLTIGYGIDVEVFDERTLEKNLDIVCVRLISRYPFYKDDIKNQKKRVFKYYLNNPALTNLWMMQKIRLKPYVNKYPFNERDHWITYNKCDLCKVCKIPELNFQEIK